MAVPGGSDHARQLLERVEAARDWTATTPGACNAVRFLASDDPDRLGWDTILDILGRDGTFGFRMLPASGVDAARQRLGAAGYRLDLWQVFLGGRPGVLAATDPILAEPVPDGLREISLHAEPDPDLLTAVQAFLRAQGMAPFGATMLSGALEPVVTVALLDGDGTPVATAHGYRPHGPESPHHRLAWVGLVATAPAWRGRGLGRYINARAARLCLTDLGADGIYELVSADNAASAAMVRACGLALDPTHVSGIATAQAGRFTR